MTNVDLLNMTAILAILGAVIVIMLLVALIGHAGTIHRGETATFVKFAVGVLVCLVIWAAVSNGPEDIGSTILNALFKL
jgi:NADH:ubiquinone oxidoreductase subunit 6 (subunit J)